MPGRKSLRGATRRSRRVVNHRQPVTLDRWLDRLVDIAVITALLVGSVALVVTFF
ncbi:hypothetical protein GCM10007160_36900 [Litchfieldella qijiaojingensis]|uniref:RDD family protein n=1 Tax=Litchfieldella qijiaojingensis TaxID=980347 RepID=A0ABQ2Z5R9_9GAMM|nr:hypothetical protein [Halomonas qijiaojingensis]GGY05935.1 hypothetical protein GCM10007160_36900 [Halomonas qijiaojingensis]